MAGKLIPCKTCGHEVSKSAKQCPNCGEKLKSDGFSLSPFWFIIIAVISIYFILQPSEEEEAKLLQESIQSLKSAKVSKYSTGGVLKRVFTYGSDHTDVQRDNLEKKNIGKVIQWRLQVYEVDKRGDYYMIQTVVED